ncbi:MAG: hypothetical protein RKO24_17970 [Candidatus Competibacter sp.]|nr:hypothetical protein [Candidatus Competibacter sp.]
MMKRIFPLFLLTVVSCGSGQAGQPPRDATSGGPPITTPPITPTPTVQNATVGNFNLSLTGCQLAYEGADKTGKIDFGFPAPCQFGRDRKGNVRVVSTGKALTLLVESSRPADPSSSLSSRDCVTLIRGVVVTPREIRLSVQTQKVAQCLPAEWDEKMFYAFAAKTQPTGVIPGQ